MLIKKETEWSSLCVEDLQDKMLEIFEKEIEKARIEGAIKAVKEIKIDIATFERVMRAEMDKEVKEYLEDKLKQLTK